MGTLATSNSRARGTLGPSAHGHMDQLPGKGPDLPEVTEPQAGEGVTQEPHSRSVPVPARSASCAGLDRHHLTDGDSTSLGNSSEIPEPAGGRASIWTRAVGRGPPDSQSEPLTPLLRPLGGLRAHSPPARRSHEAVASGSWDRGTRMVPGGKTAEFPGQAGWSVRSSRGGETPE